MFSAITVSLVPEARGGPFVFWDGVEDACQQAAALGFDAIEVFPRSAEELDVAQLRRVLRQSGLRLAGMGTGAGWLVHKLRLTDPDRAVRRRAVEFASAIVETAGELGAPAIVGSMQGRWEGEVNRERALGWLAEALEALAQRARALGMALMLEPLNRYETNLLNRVGDTLAFLEHLPAPNVKLLCDLFHMNIEEASIADALRLAGPRLGHLHFADSNRLAVGCGHIDIPPITQALLSIGYEGYISAEIYPIPHAKAAATQTMKSYVRYFVANLSPVEEDRLS